MRFSVHVNSTFRRSIDERPSLAIFRLRVKVNWFDLGKNRSERRVRS